LAATDCALIKASCYSIVDPELPCLARANEAGIAILSLRSLAKLAFDLRTDFSSTLIV
jgi:hypothetical protein